MQKHRIGNAGPACFQTGVVASLFTSAALAALSMPVTVVAAEKAASQFSLEEIIVTATRREGRLIDAPMALSVLTQDDIDVLGIGSFNDIATSVPGISLQTFGPGSVQVNMRGVSTGVGVSQTVGIYIDDVPYSGSSVGLASGLDPHASDFERIEVLRGPQGTLYGASTMGGLIKFVSIKPDLQEMNGNTKLGLSATRYGGLNETIEAALNTPLVQDKLAVRVSGYYTHNDGFIENIATGKDDNSAKVYGGRADFLLQATEDLSVRVVAYGQNINRGGQFNIDLRLADGLPYHGEMQQNRLTPETFTQHYRQLNGTIDYDFGGATLTSITSYQRSTTDQYQDGSTYFGPLLGGMGLVFPKYSADTDLKTETFTEEARLVSATGNRLEWIAGFYYTHRKNFQYQSVQPLNADSSSVDGFDLLTARLNGKQKEIAGYGDITYHFNPAFDVTLGLRVSHTKSNSNQSGSGLLFGSAPPASSSQTVVTYLFNPRYKVSDNITAYVRVASGYRPGGPNIVALDPDTQEPLARPEYTSDKLWSYEAGVKVATPDNKLSLDVNVFYIDWTNIQIVATRNGIGVIDNATKAKSQGIEFAMNAKPLEGLDLGASLAFTDPKLTEASPDLGGARGERLPDTAKFTAALSANYNVVLQNDWVATFGSSFRYIGERYSSFSSSGSIPQFHLPSYTITDLRAGLDFGSFRTTVYVDNVFDERGLISAYSGFAIAGAPVQANIIQPRTFGVTLQASF